jgi:hypothetical protein
MNSKLELYLKEKYPKLYTDCGEDEPFTLFGFECNDGWFRIILWMSNYIQTYIDQQNEYAKKYPDSYLPVDQVKILQVKEKFATLRIYTSGGNDRINAIISFVEYISGFICEYSGNTEDVGYNTKGWRKTSTVEFTNDKKNYAYVDDEKLRQILSEIKISKDNIL